MVLSAMKVKRPRNAPRAGPDRNPSQEPTDRPQRPIPGPPGSESASLEGRTALPCTSSLVAAVDDSTSACLAGSCRLLRRYPRRNTTRRGRIPNRRGCSTPRRGEVVVFTSSRCAAGRGSPCEPPVLQYVKPRNAKMLRTVTVRPPWLPLKCGRAPLDRRGRTPTR